MLRPAGPAALRAFSVEVMNTMTFHEAVLTADDELELSRAIEVGVLAEDQLARPVRRVAASPDELDALARAGRAAFTRLTEANYRLVAHVAHQVARRSGLDADELFQEGVVGLIEAIRRFDYRRGVRFATYALPWIRLYVSDAAASRCGSINLPPGSAKERIRAVAAQDALSARLGRRPDIHEIGTAANLRPARVVELLAHQAPVAAADLTVLEPHVAGPGPGDDGAEITDHLAVARLLRGLSPELRAVIRRLYGLDADGPGPLTAQETAEQLGLSVSTVRRREKVALDVLRGRVEVCVA